MKKLLWIISAFNKDSTLGKIDLFKLNDLAQDYDYDVEFAVVTNLQSFIDYELSDELKKKGIKAHYKVYEEKTNENFAIMECQKDSQTDKVFVMNSIYGTDHKLISQLLSQSVNSPSNMLHAKRKRSGFIGGIKDLMSFFYNIVCKMFTGSKDLMYISNLCIYDNNCLKLMQQFPKKSAIMRETDFLSACKTDFILLDENQKVARLSQPTLYKYAIGIGVFALSVLCFILSITLELSLGNFLSLLVGFIVLVIGSGVYIFFQYLNDKVKYSSKYNVFTEINQKAHTEKLKSKLKSKKSNIISAE